jgi:hypothetical protein
MKIMEILECSEAFVELEGDLAFAHTKIVLKDNYKYFYATTDQRYHHGSNIDLSTLDLIPIDTTKVWPLCPPDFTIAPEPLPPNCYVKRAALLYYGTARHLLKQTLFCFKRPG